MNRSLHKTILNAIQDGKSRRQLAKDLGINRETVNRWASVPLMEAYSGSLDAASTRDDILKLLRKHKVLSASEMAEATKDSISNVEKMLSEAKRSGLLITKTESGLYAVQEPENIPSEVSELVGRKGAIQHELGFITDTHLCNKHCRLDIINAAYDEFSARGITDVIHAGNIIDGEARFNRNELVVAPGMDRQVNYLIDKYPQRKGITTRFIAGDDHEGWYQQREGVEIGKYIEMQARDQGRNDLGYLGYAEHDIRLKFGAGSAVARVVHPGGGSAYAISYTDQKRVESYQGGEKPHIEFVGHYHKFNYGYPREVHTIQGGCTLGQTMFMRKKRLQAHLGFSIVSISQDERGAITGVSIKWFPFFDQGYYDNRRFA